MMDSPEKILYKEYGSQGGEDHLINSRSLQGRASIAVHLRTFGSRYRQTHNPQLTMKVIRVIEHRFIKHVEQ